jgi:catechol 2,3-dioxygenase-like lactoylglutathione lyase family enzyme
MTSPTGATHFRPERSEGASQPSGLSPALMTKQISDVGTRASCSWPNCKTIWRRRVSSQSELSLPNAPATKVKVPVDLDKTVEFYEKLGFQFKGRDPGRATAYLNWWWFDFHEADAADALLGTSRRTSTTPSRGAPFYFSVENVQKAYEDAIASGLQPSSEPIELRGNREFMLLDPDGYRLVFFKRK